MQQPYCSVVQVSAQDNRGGAARVAWNLHQTYVQRGVQAWMAVGQKRSEAPNVVLIPNAKAKTGGARIVLKMSDWFEMLNTRIRGTWRVSRVLRWLAEPQRQWAIHCGREDVPAPGTWHLLTLFPEMPVIVHCHNLHNGYFDLRALPWLSQQRPVVVTLHDAWLLSGHCAHSLACERWKSGCGHCPDLSLYPAIKRDMTAYNWQRKRELFTRSQLYVATPSHWLMEKVQHSILAPALVDTKIIPNGVDRTVFCPGNKREARRRLQLPGNAKILLWVAEGGRRNVYKDYATMQEAVARVAAGLQGGRLMFLVLGEEAPAGHIGTAEVRFIPYQFDPMVVCLYYQAADLCLHAARAETFGNAVVEAMACGTPVVATAVGGIPELIEDGRTGFLMPPGNSAAMAACIRALLHDDYLCQRIAAQAAERVRYCFDLHRQVDDYLSWYQEIANQFLGRAVGYLDGHRVVGEC
jgi:glycosyltransferase involved in cell wall biosynthesis